MFSFSRFNKAIFLFFLLPSSCSDLAVFTANIFVDANTSIILNEDSLFGFMTEKDQVVNVVNTLQGMKSGDFSDEGMFEIQNTSFTLTLVGEIASPIVDGVTLQATTVVLRGSTA